MSDTESEARDSWYNHLDKFLTLGESHGSEIFKEEAVSRVLVRILLSKGQIQHKECFNEEEKNLIKIEMENLWTQMERKFQERDIEKCYDKYTYYANEEPLEKKKRAEEPQGEKQKAEEHWISLGNSKEDSRKHKSERKKVPSAFRLENGGVKIQASGEIVQDIRFVGKTLHIPPIQLDSDSEIFIRNLVALEVYAPYSPLKRMTAFVQFMNELCPTEKGAAVLREKGVIFGNLEKHSEVTRLFSLCKQSHSLSSCHPIQITRKKLIKYYSRKSRIAAAEAWNEFQKTYFSKPWLLIGGIGATIILILTAVQVFCLFHSCGA
ncbi:hypothetical protein SUGI_0570540 [Cryptomeria japonica]|nr:hypothetical protein SUGI_0570540 [Cryptomeria japonica]